MACGPSIWWCPPDGPEEVTPDRDGVYTRPSDATGHPFKSLAEAMAVCPPPPVSLGCPSACESGQTIPYVFDLSFTDKTGSATCLPNSLPMTFDGIYPPGSRTWQNPRGPVPGFPSSLFGTLCGAYTNINFGTLAINSPASCVVSISINSFNNSQPFYFVFLVGGVNTSGRLLWNMCEDGPLPSVLGPYPMRILNSSFATAGTFNLYVTF